MQNKLKNILGTALVALVPTAAMASSHREAPAISNDPAADNTDLYAWVAPTTHDKLIVLANYIPLEEPSGGPNFHSFSDDVRYEVHFYKGDDIHHEFVTYQIEFNTSHAARGNAGDPAAGVIGSGLNFFSQISGDAQTYTVKRIAANGQKTTLIQNAPVAPANIGPRTDAVAYQAISSGFVYDDAHIAASFIKNTSDGGRVFCGPRDDGFYVDLGGVFDLANLRPNGTAQDGVAGYNTHTIALEIPMSVFFATTPTTSSNNSVISVWASASRRKVSVLKNNGEVETSGPFVQVSRLGLPLINEAVIGLQDKDRWNALEPKDDVPKFGGYFLNPVIVRDAQAVGILGADISAVDRNRTDILDVIGLKATNPPINLTDAGDVLRLDVSHDSAFPNGRALQGANDVFGHPMGADQEKGDVTDIEVSLLLTKNPDPVSTGISDGVQHNDKPFLATFPFLALPWRGFDQGHGKTTLP